MRSPLNGLLRSYVSNPDYPILSDLNCFDASEARFVTPFAALFSSW